jgi:hypothetical protein
MIRCTVVEYAPGIGSSYQKYFPIPVCAAGRQGLSSRCSRRFLWRHSCVDETAWGQSSSPLETSVYRQGQRTKNLDPGVHSSHGRPTPAQCGSLILKIIVPDDNFEIFCQQETVPSKKRAIWTSTLGFEKRKDKISCLKKSVPIYFLASYGSIVCVVFNISWQQLVVEPLVV